MNFQDQLCASKVKWQEHEYISRTADSQRTQCQILRLYLFKQTVLQIRKMVHKEVQSGEILICKTVFCWNNSLTRPCHVTLNKSFKERTEFLCTQGDCEGYTHECEMKETVNSQICFLITVKVCYYYNPHSCTVISFSKVRFTCKVILFQKVSQHFT